MTISTWIRRLRFPSITAGSATRSRTFLLWLLVGLLAYVMLTVQALRSLRSSDAQLARLEEDRQVMTELVSEARRLSAQVKEGTHDGTMGTEALRMTLPAGVSVMGAGRIVTATLKGVRAEVLARWLVQLRTAYRIDITEAHLSASAPGVWNGTLKLQGAEDSDGH